MTVFARINSLSRSKPQVLSSWSFEGRRRKTRNEDDDVCTKSQQLPDEMSIYQNPGFLEGKGRERESVPLAVGREREGGR